MNNQRGGIISTIFVIPIGLVLMIGIFFLGYYVGKYKSKEVEENIALQPMPEVVSENLPKKEDFTFFKTLTDRGNKTVSIDLKPRTEEAVVEKKRLEPEQQKEQVLQPKKESKPETKAPKTPPASETKIQTAKKEPVITRSPDPKVRYTLQIASYQEKGMAEADVRKMKQKGYAAFIVSSEIEGKGTWYRVRVGSFTNRAAAEKLQKELHAKAGVAPFITVE